MTYGRPDINAVLDRLRERIDLPLDGSTTEQRRYAKMLIDKMKRDYPLRDPLETALQLIDITFTPTKELEFHARNATSPKYIYWNASRIIAAWRAAGRKSPEQRGSDNADRAADATARIIIARRQARGHGSDDVLRDDQGGAGAADAGPSGEAAGRG